MKSKAQEIPQPVRDPALDLIKTQAADDQRIATGKMLEQKTQDLLLRYGQRAALSGAGMGAAPLRLGG